MMPRVEVGSGRLMNLFSQSAACSQTLSGQERRLFVVRGIVQGVGFRPFIYRLAVRLGIAGFVRNDRSSVLIEAQGAIQSLDSFQDAIHREAPPFARIDSIECQTISSINASDFQVLPSVKAASGAVSIPPDLGTCPQCLGELHNPSNRRYRYPFLNCTNCGPRLTIIHDTPYDRSHTTMAGFSMCAGCRAEYEDPKNRRFHAEPIACADCGPELSLVSRNGFASNGDEPLEKFAMAVLSGQIGALKGIGGFHLVCDARNPAAVSELRLRKHRDEKPFAIMVPDTHAALAYCAVSPLEQELLESSASPIVILDRNPVSCALENQGPCQQVAPGQTTLGVMLPYSPLHAILMDAVNGIPLVMTSGNRTDEPIVQQEVHAIDRLRDIADIFLMHNRPISVRCDDSIGRVIANSPVLLRRSRGYAPASLILPMTLAKPVLAVGGQQKGTFALGIGELAVLSHHLGDLDDFGTYCSFEHDLQLYERLFEFKPERIVCDLHPDYAATRYAEHRAEKDGVELLKVQHHHAHIASCMAENGLDEPVIGVAFDGTGFGESGPVDVDAEYCSGASAVWGGEFLIADYASCQRFARLRYVAMPGGQAAIREPWRMAVSQLHDAGLHSANLTSFPMTVGEQPLQTMIERRVNSPATSSMGRLFDAIASMIGIRQRVSYEGQAAIDLEGRAAETPPDTFYPFDLLGSSAADSTTSPRPLVIDTRPLIRAVFEEVNRGTPSSRIARRFHSTIAEIVLQTCTQIRQQTGIDAVALSGGVFANRVLTEDVVGRLGQERFRIFRHRMVPPNDGGLSLGQLAIASRAECH